MSADSSRERPTAVVRLQVPFHDLDPLQVVWHGNYLKYFEIARDRLFEERGLHLYQYYQDRHYMFPIVRTSTKHVHPLRYGDRFEVCAELGAARVKLVVQYTLRLVDHGTLCAKGHTEQVAVRTEDLSLELRIPTDIQKLFGVAE